MPAHEDELLMRAGPLRPGQYYDFETQRVEFLPLESERRAQGMRDARAQKPPRSRDSFYLRGYELESASSTKSE